jgi:hypothetical protein
MHVGSQMLTFIKILCKIIFYYKNSVFWYFKVVLCVRAICTRAVRKVSERSK